MKGLYYKVREVGQDRYSYAGDYTLIARLKEFAGNHKLCLLLVHHTRKQQTEDKFDMISGTNGLLGAADGVFLMQKLNRSEPMASVSISGRDQQDQVLILKRDVQHCAGIWSEQSVKTGQYLQILC